MIKIFHTNQYSFQASDKMKKKISMASISSRHFRRLLKAEQDKCVISQRSVLMQPINVTLAVPTNEIGKNTNSAINIEETPINSLLLNINNNLEVCGENNEHLKYAIKSKNNYDTYDLSV